MDDRIGMEFDAVICSVTGFGFFARTENLCDGLIPIETLDRGFLFDKENLILQNGKTTFRLGQKVRVRVDHCDITARRIIFTLLEYEEIDAPKINLAKAQKTTQGSKKSSSKKHSHPKKPDRNRKKTLTKSLRKKKHRR